MLAAMGGVKVACGVHRNQTCPHLHESWLSGCATRVHSRKQLWPIPPPQVWVVRGSKLMHAIPQVARAGLLEDHDGTIQDGALWVALRETLYA